MAMLMARRSVLYCARLARTVSSGGGRQCWAAAAEAAPLGAGGSGDPPADIIEEPRPTAEDTEVTKQLNELLAQARSNNQSATEALKSYSGGFTLEGVSRTMFSLKDAEASKALLDWAANQPGFFYTSRLLANMIRGMSAAGQTDQGRKIVEQLGDRFQPTELVYRTLIRNYVAEGKLETAGELAKQMLSRGFHLGRGTVVILLDLRLKELGIDGMMDYYRSRVRDGWIADGKPLEFVVVQLTDAGRVQEAYDVFSEVYHKCKETDKELSENAHHVMMKALCESKMLDEAYTVTKWMMERGFRCHSPPFRVVVNAMAEAGRLDQAYEILLAALEAKVFVTGGELVAAFLKAGKLDSAVEVVRKLKDELNNRDARIMISAFLEHGKLEEARLVFETLLQRGFSPEGDICCMMLDGYVKSLPEGEPRRKKYEQDEGRLQKRRKSKKLKKKELTMKENQEKEGTEDKQGRSEEQEQQEAKPIQEENSEQDVQVSSSSEDAQARPQAGFRCSDLRTVRLAYFGAFSPPNLGFRYRSVD